MSKVSSRAKLIISFVYNPPRNSRWYNLSFTEQLEEGSNNSRDVCPNAGILIMGKSFLLLEHRKGDRVVP
jgi:hypothetical protein